jgi:hypothetical protein
MEDKYSPPVSSCLVCGYKKELAVYVEPLSDGTYHGVCYSCRDKAQSESEFEKLYNDAARQLNEANLKLSQIAQLAQRRQEQ